MFIPLCQIMLLLILVLYCVAPISSYQEVYFHEEFYKQETPTGSRLVLLTEDSKTQLYPTSKHCLREDRPLKRRRKSKQSHVTTWIDFLNEFYWDNGKEYTKWLHVKEDFKEEEGEPWYMVFSVLGVVFFYILSMLLTGLLAPFLSILLFRLCFWIWELISSDCVKKFLRRMWICNELRKRSHQKQIYSLSNTKAPKFRPQLPWMLRTHPDEEVEELKDLISPDSEPVSSDGEDNGDFAYDEADMDEEDKKVGLSFGQRWRKRTSSNNPTKAPATGGGGIKTRKSLALHSPDDDDVGAYNKRNNRAMRRPSPSSIELSSIEDY